ncbi:unnamed protein product [Cyprideis torosa]|uniref:Sulfotransferase domain-containing protein n=1 Tax=Cyprideis torosa TaxID=163714 RepID=A0A7R8ZIQ4_9CRUS|nr:unnamed protein product [Cyprideis torosa]CAG0886722.1 unnamed protein product [Cyprideis torosa]
MNRFLKVSMALRRNCLRDFFWRAVLCWGFIATALLLRSFESPHPNRLEVSRTSLSEAKYFPNGRTSGIGLTAPSAYYAGHNGTSRHREDTVKTLLLTYGRSGSSFLGELLAAYPHTAYYYEPLHLTASDLRICPNSTEIVHLYRDPRAMANSRRKSKDFKPFIDIMCYPMIINFYELQDFPAERYRIVRYEDIVENPSEVAKELFEFLALPMEQKQIDQAIEQRIPSQQNASATDLKESKRYAGTVRFRESLDPAKWVKELPQELRRQTEEKCGKIIQALDYAPFQCDIDIESGIHPKK